MQDIIFPVLPWPNIPAVVPAPMPAPAPVPAPSVIPAFFNAEEALRAFQMGLVRYQDIIHFFT